MRSGHGLGGCPLFKFRHNFGEAVGFLNRLPSLSELLSLSPCDGSYFLHHGGCCKDYRGKDRSQYHSGHAKMLSKR